MRMIAGDGNKQQYINPSISGPGEEGDGWQQRGAGITICSLVITKTGAAALNIEYQEMCSAPPALTALRRH